MKKAQKTKINYKRTHKGLKSISMLAQDIGRKSFKKQGFNGIEIFKQWPYIVGDDLAQYCAPEKINWPHARGELMTDRFNGATLIIKCLGAFALEIESLAPTILQRANVMFGYAALGKIKIKQVQTIEFEKIVTEEMAPKTPQNISRSTQPIHNEKLRDALNALGAQIYKDKSQKNDDN